MTGEPPARMAASATARAGDMAKAIQAVNEQLTDLAAAVAAVQSRLEIPVQDDASRLLRDLWEGMPTRQPRSYDPRRPFRRATRK